MKSCFTHKLTAVLALAFLVACSESPPIDISLKSTPTTPLLQCTASERLPEQLDRAGATRLGEPRTILPDSSAAYLGESANRYRLYHFVGMASTKYLIENDTIELELAQFETDVDAFGFAASFRSNGADNQGVGTVSFIVENRFYGSVGDFVLTLSALTSTDSSLARTMSLAREIGGLMVSKPPPGWFMFFPSSNQVMASARYFAYDYLGVYGLNEVYSIDYEAGQNIATFFLIPDTTGQKYTRLKILAESTGRVVSSPKGMTFDPGLSLAFEHPDLGIIVFGVKQKKIIGIIGYDPREIGSLASGWIKGFN